MSALSGGVAPARGSSFLLLIADADTNRAVELSSLLAEHQVSSIVCADGAEALVLAGAEHPDAVLATAALPTVGGAVVARALSARTTVPVVVGIGDGDGPAAAEALTAGAAACVAHPYRLREVLPILKAIRPDGVAEARVPLEAGALRLDPASLEVHLHGQLVRMPMRELRLLELLMSNADRIVTREQIRDSIWGGVPGSNTITVHVQRLRQRLGDDQVDPKLILTIRGVGYRLIPPAVEA
jgi:DNA-binding response OmpR family regulator